MVHLWGMPVDMGPVMAIAARHGLKVVEDAAQAHGAVYRGKKLGAIGDVGCFSFQASKLLPGTEGGVLVTNNRGYYERAVALGHYERIGKLPEDSPYRYAEERERVSRLVGRHYPSPEAASLSVTDRIHERLLSLPTFPQGTRELMDQYVRAFKKVSEQWPEIPEVKADQAQVDNTRAVIR